ncbi:MAG: hypothetical protein IJ497_11850 [Clostridia bacterium]|nr:hypothetical protein [Clostridia bacterium]
MPRSRTKPIRRPTNPTTARKNKPTEWNQTPEFTKVRAFFITIGGFDDIYLIEKNVVLSELHLQPEEVQAAKWADRDEILAMIDDGSFIPYHKSLIELLFFMRNHDGTHTRPDTTVPVSQ